MRWATLVDFLLHLKLLSTLYVSPHQSIDVFRFVYKHTDLFGISSEDCLDKWWLWRAEEDNSTVRVIILHVTNARHLYCASMKAIPEVEKTLL